DDEMFYFMDSETFDQFPFRADAIGDTAKFLKEQQEVTVQIHEEELIGVELPISVIFKVTHTEPGVKGDTVSSTTKPATIETGAVVAVPLFINIGDMIKVDTRNGNYLERAKS
ncbi:MAG: elongation factor P, partial [Candidatus Dadabacteria bacterium]|nr:elongation factor P [Candidatus Dadabacteria bacterium]